IWNGAGSKFTRPAHDAPERSEEFTVFRTAAASLILTMTLGAGSAFAAESTSAELTPATDSLARYANGSWLAPSKHVEPLNRDEAMRRPASLPVLYASFAALQAFDFVSTRQALARGGAEANPAMKGIVKNAAAFAAVKAATTLGPMLIAQRMWRTNRVGAVVT